MQDEGILECGSDFAIPYFVSFVLIITFIAMNLTVAAVIDGLASARKDEGALISADDIDTYIHLWSDYDPKATGWIPIESYVFLLYELPKPIGLGKQLPTSQNMDIDSLYVSRRRHNAIESRIYLEENTQDYVTLDH